jgi:hypothetical protein
MDTQSKTHSSMLQKTIQNAFKEKKYVTGFDIIWESKIDSYDKYLALIIYSYYQLNKYYWKWITESVLKNCVVETIYFNGTFYTVEDYVIGSTFVDFVRKRKKEHFDVIVFEAIHAICVGNHLDQLKKLHQLSTEINHRIPFKMYSDVLVKTCEDSNLYQMVDFLFREDVRNPQMGTVESLIKQSTKAIKDHQFFDP